MRIDYVPLLPKIRELYGLPRSMERFREYLRTMVNERGDDVDFPPLVAVNPMAKEHAATLLDEFLALGADSIAANEVQSIAARDPEIEAEFKASLIVVDDLKGGWTNRAAYEYQFRFPDVTHHRFWITGALWTSEAATADAARIAIATAAFRAVWILQNGPAKTLRAAIRQEGWVLLQAGCTSPRLDEEDLAYTREVIEPFLEAGGMREYVECLLGDDAAKTLGFTPRGLSSNAGLALGLADARMAQPTARARPRWNRD